MHLFTPTYMFTYIHTCTNIHIQAEGTWKCDTCLTGNPPNTPACLSCQAPNPKGIDNTSSAKTDSTTTSAPKEESKPTFAFGIASGTTESQTVPNPVFGSGEAPKFAFGTPSASDSAPKFSFGTPSATASSADSAPKFSFGTPSVTSTSNSTPSFSFGTPQH